MVRGIHREVANGRLEADVVGRLGVATTKLHVEVGILPVAKLDIIPANAKAIIVPAQGTIGVQEEDMCLLEELLKDIRQGSHLGQQAVQGRNLLENKTMVRVEVSPRGARGILPVNLLPLRVALPLMSRKRLA